MRDNVPVGSGDPTDDLDTALDRAFSFGPEDAASSPGLRVSSALSSPFPELGPTPADVRSAVGGGAPGAGLDDRVLLNGPPSGSFPRVTRVPLGSGFISRAVPGTSGPIPLAGASGQSGRIPRAGALGSLLSDEAASLAEALTFGVILSDGEGVVRDANGAARRIFGVADGALPGTRLLDLFEDSARPTMALLLQDTFRGKPPREVDLVALGRQGPVPVRVAATGRFDAERHLREIVWSLRDTGSADPAREVRVLDAKVETLAELGVELGREVGPAIVRLTEVLVNAQKLAESGPGAAPGRDVLGVRLSEAMSGLLRLQQVVTELERFAAGAPLKLQPVDPTAVLARAETLLARSLKARRVHVRNEMDDPAPKIVADPSRLTEIFVNLLRNARNALTRRFEAADGETTSSGRRLIVFESFVKAPYAVIVVTNNGVPVPPGDVEKVFLPGYSERDPLRPGVGLPETAALIRSMGGAVRCQSLGEEGSRFVLTFRRAE